MITVKLADLQHTKTFNEVCVSASSNFKIQDSKVRMQNVLPQLGIESILRLRRI